MAEDKFKLPGSSYEEVARLIHAYARLDKDATPAEVGVTAGKHQTEVSRNNGFLLSMGIVQGGNRKRVTPEGKALGLAIEFNQDAEIAEHWRSLCERNGFVRNVLSAVRVRRGMDRPTLTSHIAYTAGQAKNKPTMTGASCLVDILLIASLLSEENGKLTAAKITHDTSVTTSEEDAAEPDVTTTEGGPALTYAVEPAGRIYRQTPRRLPVEVRLNVSIQCTPDEIPKLAPLIRQLLDDLATPPPKEGATD